MTALVSGAVVCAMRFTDRAPEAIAFYELLGLRTVIRQGDFAVLQGRGGRVAVHPLQTAASITELTTSLVLDVPDVAAATERLESAGFATAWWDESFGRQATVESPAGRLHLNAEQDDSYGFEVQPPDPDAPADVVATVYTDDPAPIEAVFASFGFEAGGDSGPGWRPLRAGSGSGVLGLLGGLPRPGGPLDDPLSAVEIGIETREPLEQVRARVAAAGHPAHWSDDGTPHLVLTDPDGVDLEVYAAPEIAREM